jgi:hypothetical protein
MKCLHGCAIMLDLPVQRTVREVGLRFQAEQWPSKERLPVFLRDRFDSSCVIILVEDSNFVLL